MGKSKLSDCELRVLPEHQQIVADKLSGIRPGRMSRPYHLFVVNHLRDLVLELHIANVFNHDDIVFRHALREEDIIGGGQVEVTEKELYLGGSSTTFRSIPIACQHAFALGLREVLNAREIPVDSIRTDISEVSIFWHQFWKGLDKKSLRKPK